MIVLQPPSPYGNTGSNTSESVLCAESQDNVSSDVNVELPPTKPTLGSNSNEERIQVVHLGPV